MKRFRPLILAAIIIMAGLLAYGLWTLPAPQPAGSEGFSSERAMLDIQAISGKHHSVAHAAERAEVREYLAGRLKGLGADTVRFFRYDSLSGPENKHVSYTFDAVNVLAEFAPPASGGNDSYLMLVAHYDSRYSQPMPKDTVWSFGAADDGYGLAVALETVSRVLSLRNEWKQGLKVLFTDAEEVGMMGMKAIRENDSDVFSDVGLLINIEARGPWGPALLFETSPGNSRVVDLYKNNAKYPYTYSLTSVVYNFMPNFTDFTVVKDEIPGMNFSTVADINHYHTDLDNFGNTSERSVQHYGAQILPVAEAYLTASEYSDRTSLESENDSTYFTVPLLGLFVFSKTGYLISNIALFVIFLMLAAFEVLRGRLKLSGVFRNAGLVLLSAVVVLLLGEAVAFICALAAGAGFKLFGIVAGIPFDNAAMLSFIVLISAVYASIYWAGRGRTIRRTSGSMRSSAPATAASKYAYNMLYGVLCLDFILSAVLVFALGENLMFAIPLFCAAAAMVLYHATGLRMWLPLAIGLMLLHAFSFLYALAMALTIGALGVVAMIAFLDIMVILPMADLYLANFKKR